MPFDFSNNNLIASIKRRASMPTSQVLFQPADFLILADEELLTNIFPMIMSVKGDYFVGNSDTVMTSALSYPIPSDAIGLKIKDVYFLNANGDERQLTQVDVANIANQYFRLDTGFSYYIQGNNVILYPDSKVGETLRIKYYKRASKLVPNNEAGQVSSINSGLLELTLTNVPTAWTTANTLSVVDDQPGFETKVEGLTISAIADPVITVSSVTDIAVNDWICLDGDSPVAQIAPNAQAILAQSIAVKCLEAVSDPGVLLAQGKLKEIKNAFIDSMTPRADGQAKKIVNRRGHLAWGKFSRIGWR